MTISGGPPGWRRDGSPQAALHCADRLLAKAGRGRRDRGETGIEA